MAQRVVTQLVSDLTGDDIPDGEGETIEFAFRGTQYVIDLTAKEAAGFDKSIAMYLEHATKVARGASGRRSGGGRSNGSGRTPEELAAVREWARENGHEVSERGRIRQEVLEAYDAAR